MGTTNIIVLDNWYWEWVQLHIYQKAYNRFTQNQEPACIHQNIYSTAPRSYQEM